MSAPSSLLCLSALTAASEARSLPARSISVKLYTPRHTARLQCFTYFHLHTRVYLQPDLSASNYTHHATLPDYNALLTFIYTRGCKYSQISQRQTIHTLRQMTRALLSLIYTVSMYCQISVSRPHHRGCHPPTSPLPLGRFRPTNGSSGLPQSTSKTASGCFSRLDKIRAYF